jgi:ATP-dependent helicase/DNAse subunit B
MSEHKEHTPLSASRIKTLENCSFLYYCNYILRIPQSTNLGATKGSVVHEVFETLLDSKYKEDYDIIVEAGTTKASQFIYNKIVELMLEEKMDPKEYQHIDEMILVGLKNDFFVEGSILLAPEYKFDITNEENTIRIKGFLDKPVIKDDKIIIYDYKSSKKKYEGEEKDSNIQGLVYSLVAKKIWPTLKPVIKFIFLQFPDDPIITLEFRDTTLKGLEKYLEMIQEKINNFTEKDAKQNMAADKIPKDGGFNGNLLCGRAKYAGQLKKDGTLMYSCVYKWPFSYYVSLKDGKIMNSDFNKDSLEVKDGEIIEKRNFEGCPRFQQTLNNFQKASIQDFPNALNDF